MVNKRNLRVDIEFPNCSQHARMFRVVWNINLTRELYMQKLSNVLSIPIGSIEAWKFPTINQVGYECCEFWMVEVNEFVENNEGNWYDLIKFDKKNLRKILENKERDDSSFAINNRF